VSRLEVTRTCRISERNQQPKSTFRCHCDRLLLVLTRFPQLGPAGNGSVSPLTDLRRPKQVLQPNASSHIIILLGFGTGHRRFKRVGPLHWSSISCGARMVASSPGSVNHCMSKPEAMCQETWQWKLQTPGLSATNRRTVQVYAFRTTVSRLQTGCQLA